MNTKIKLASTFFLFVLFSVQCQTNPKASDNKQIPGTNNAGSPSWLTATKVADKVWSIDDHGGDNIYLIEGNDSALLIDTGTGVADLASLVKSITQLPLIVVNTHGHPDHSAGNFQFQKVYAHPSDFNMIEQFNSKEYHKNAIKQATNANPGFQSLLLTDSGSGNISSVIPIKQGHIFDLGNRKLEVIEVPGHTKGSICLLDAENRILFTGDNNNTLVWLFLEDCLPLELYLQTLENLNQRSGEFDTIYPGHGEPLDKAFIADQIICAQNIINGVCIGNKYEPFVDYALVCSYKRASIAYNPANLKVKE